MNESEAKDRLNELREHLMDELDKASTERDFERVTDLQNGFTALSVLERVVGA